MSAAPNSSAYSGFLVNQPLIQSGSFYKPSWLPDGPGGTRTVFWRKTFVHDLSSQAGEQPPSTKALKGCLYLDL